MIGGDSASIENPNRRVKVYVLGVDGQWDDRGTGYVKCEIIPVRSWMLSFRMLHIAAIVGSADARMS